MHTRMFELAAAELQKRDTPVLGAYLSPVNDAYGKAGLAPGTHRVAMCAAAAADSPLVMVDAWEAQQQGYTRTLQVLRHVRQELRRLAGGGRAQQEQQQKQEQQQQQQQDERQRQDQEDNTVDDEPRVLLLCGADVLASMAVPGLWRDPDVLLREFGVVCLARHGTDLERLLGGADGTAAGREGTRQTEGSAGDASAGTKGGLAGEAGGSAQGDLSDVLHRFRSHITLVELPEEDLAWGGHTLSSSVVRARLQEGASVEGLVHPAVQAYIRQHGLYCSSPAGQMG